MELFKNEPNPVGRPSNESLKKKRNKKILVGVLVAVALLLVGGGAYLLISGTDLTELMGNSVTQKITVCPSLSDYNKTTKQCEYTTALKNACPTGYTYKDGKCQKQKSSTSGIQATYDSKTKTYKCPADTKTSTTITKYVKSGQKTCIKNVYEIKSAYGACGEVGSFVRNGECVYNEHLVSYNVSEKSPGFKLEAFAASESFFNTLPKYDYNFYINFSNEKLEKELKRKYIYNKIFIDMYEVKNGKYTLYKTEDFDGESVTFVVNFEAAMFNSNRTFMFKYRFIDDITGKTISTNYMNKVVLSPEKFPHKPSIKLENGYIRVDSDFWNPFPSEYLRESFVQYYEIVGGEYKYIKECPYMVFNNNNKNQYKFNDCLKAGTGRKYSARLKIPTKNGKFTYTLFSDILKTGSTKPSS